MNIQTPLPVKIPIPESLNMTERNELKRTEDEINRNFMSMYDTLRIIAKELENG